jgi:exodeoxyribonuclease-1
MYNRLRANAVFARSKAATAAFPQPACKARHPRPMIGPEQPMAASLLWYDLETFGTHPQWDRIAQFAAIRTNEHFEELEEPVVSYCRLSPDYLPHPDACLTTGITPQEANEKGVSEREFAARIYEQMIRPGTTTAGYNTIRFDDEFVRALFYRNFYDPYRREYEHGNARWDIIDLLRMCRDLRPEGIEWVTDEEGKPSFRLEELTRANGIAHVDAHDALADVRATVSVARLVREAQPRLFEFYFKLRLKDQVRRQLSLQNPEPVVHTSAMFTSRAGCTTLVLPVSAHPRQNNVIIAYDLRRDPTDWLDASAEEIRRRVFTRSEELAPQERIPLKGVHINRVPAVAPRGTLTSERAAALEIDVDRCLANAGLIRSRPEVLQKVYNAFEPAPPIRYSDPELQIYSGDFFPDEDREEFEMIRSASPQALKENPPTLYDPRGPELLRRYIARNFPESLSEQEYLRWKSFCAGRLLTPEPEGAIDFASFRRLVANRLSRVDTPAAHKPILKALSEYADELERTVLS